MSKTPSKKNQRIRTNKKGGPKVPKKVKESHKIIFEKFMQWAIMSRQWVKNTEEQLLVMGLEPEEIDLAKIGSQKEFAKAFGVGESQLVAWKKTEEFEKVIARMKEFHRRKLPAMMNHLGNAIYSSSTPNPSLVKMYLEHGMGMESAEDRPSTDLTDLLAGVKTIITTVVDLKNAGNKKK